MSERNERVYEFGPFRLEVADRLLMRDGTAVELPPKAFDLLVLMVTNHGHLVEKDYLINALWPDSVVIEANLNIYISALRKALGDSPAEPQYIKTVPRQGYRFVANVNELLSDSVALLGSEPNKSREPSEEALPAAQSEQRHGRLAITLISRVAKHKVVLSLTGLLLLLFGVSLALFRDGSNSSSPGPPNASVPVRARQAVAVLGIKSLSVRSDTAWLSTALPEMINTELATGGRLQVIAGEQVSRMKMELSLPDADSFALDTLARIRMNLKTDFVVLGSYLVIGEGEDWKVRLDLRLQDAASGETLCAVSDTGTEAGLLELVSRVGMKLRQKLGV